MNKYKMWHNELIAKDIVERLNRKKYNAFYAPTLEDAKNKVLELIPEGSSIALGGSVTIEELGLIEIFRNGPYKLFDRYKPMTAEERIELFRQSLLADILVTSTNAITKNGELVNVDCSGNRVSAMIFGPKKVIIVAGVNKVVEDLDEAFKRLKKIAPMNSKRNNHKTPCIETGYCMDCQIKARMCNYITIINHGMKFEGRLNIIIVPFEIGF
ncbi:YkgG family uncharacterized protein [Caldicellulosiruptor bescii]|jgi:L-lactate utilization protein LutB|uniref:LUD domain-containing protein n=2 Tax=Caldicellulosiruptor bescii TaxID=31899 RepID=B9MNC0_CALBD|nr:lactate utilization protein [Caldicellulosiruptor bescii]ACM61451.1 protein of unknown function DUF1121 [Caldicellulosiruptor bescii DSM 6725]PBC88736.1 YkgG family uncharacterized protein [Caldicellulosiruptor bescii]PBC91783.1 YkgG family uncharacterized protein [Caldicellulosiruptor bescii]PBD02806.1 YkgG family uncharacterized protein [Caldicellulosiruptor bescii]PBD07578.1 YkgG family uncharacterized protein [Caldicellulosiruptor bescii]